MVNALGVGKEEYFEGMLSGAVGVDRIKIFDPAGFDSQVAGESIHLKMNKMVPKSQRKSAKLMSRDIELAVIAADAAVKDAGLDTRANNPDGPINIDPIRSGVNIGAGSICCDLKELAAAAVNGAINGKFDLKKWGAEGIETLTPLWLLKYLPNMLSCHISIIYDLQGPSNSITCAEASGMLAVGEACSIIARNDADLMIAGGAESKVQGMGLYRQCKLNRASANYNDNPKEASRPFDKNADGNVVGDGGAILVLEELESAQKRGAKIYAEITGFGSSSNLGEGFVKSDPNGVGQSLAMKKAVKNSGLSVEQIQLLIPHGLATIDGDRAEATAIRSVFGAYTEKLPVLATKSRFGNCGAGAAAIDLATAVLALETQVIPQTVNCPDPPAEYGLNLTNAGNLKTKIDNALVTCYSYGGQTAAMVISKLKGF